MKASVGGPNLRESGHLSERIKFSRMKWDVRIGLGKTQWRISCYAGGPQRKTHEVITRHGKSISKKLVACQMRVLPERFGVLD